MGKSLLYANGVISALSTKLISKDTFNRMIDAKTNVEALAILQETSFGSGLTINSPFEIEELTNFETKKFVEFLKSESPEDELTTLFLLPYDYNNISGICKAMLLEQNENNFIEAEGFYEITKIKDIVNSKNYSSFNNKFIEECLNKFNELVSRNIIDGYEIDLLFKKYLYKNLKEMAKKPLIKQIVSNYIDIENISVAMRSDTTFILEQQKLCGGSLSLEVLLKIFAKDLCVVNEIKDSTIKKFVELAVKEDKENSFVEFEVFKNNFIFSKLLPEKYDNNKLTPFALYCFEREAQIKNVRLIMSYKNNNISSEIKKRILEW